MIATLLPTPKPKTPPLTLRPYQVEAVDAVYRYLRDRDDNPLIVLPTGCHTKGHPLLMFDGTVKPVEDIVVGDILMGPDSRPRIVQALCRGEDEMYRVTPHRGEPFVVNGDHMLSLVCTNEGKRNFACYRRGGEVDNISVREYLAKSKYWRHLRKLRQAPVGFSNNPDLPIPPYILGLLLGDGCFTADGVDLTTADEENADSWIEYVHSIGCGVTVKASGGRCPSYRLAKESGKNNILATALDALGLQGKDSGGKFIPHPYLVASRHDRLLLLAGLMDSDGHANKRVGLDHITKSRELATDLMFLVRSLGFAAHCTRKYCSCQTGNGGWFFRLSVWGDFDDVPCRLKRRKPKSRQQKKSVLRTGFKVGAVGYGKFYGFTLDGDHLYLDGNFIVHHNSGKTPVMATICRDAVQKWQGRVLILAHVRELLEQTADTLRRVAPDLEIGVYSAGLKSRDTDHPIIVAGIQSVYKRACELDAFDLILVDECFPAGTLIDGCPIETIRPGQQIRSFNHSTGRIETKPVVAVRKRIMPLRMVRVTFQDNRTITCTPNHPFFTGSEYVPAQSLMETSVVYMPRMRTGYSRTERLSIPQLLLSRADVLLEGMFQRINEPSVHATETPSEIGQEAVQPSSALENAVVHLSRMRKRHPETNDQSIQSVSASRTDVLRKRVLKSVSRSNQFTRDERTKPHAKLQHAAESIRVTQTEGPSSKNPRWQGAGFDHTATDVIESHGARVDTGISDQDRSPEIRRECPVVFRRSGASSDENLCRGRRRFSSLVCRAGSRQSAGYDLEPIGVANVEIFERSDSGRPRQGGGEHYVYNLQVEGNENYFAEDVLVHNCHMIPLDGEGMYRQFLTDAKTINPNIRVVGLTATPYRLKGGMIAKDDHFLNSVCYEIGVKELIAQGYLCPLKTKAGKIKANLDNLHVRSGEFIANEVEAAMDNIVLVQAACEEIVELTQDRKSCLLFTSGVAHGQHVARNIERIAGQECGFVCGETPGLQRETILRRFKAGELKYLANVNVLTTGFDAPSIDCVAILRPTMSPGLMYQMVGRSFRLHPGKIDALVLDYGGNILRHGPVDDLKIKEPGKGDGEAPAKECPECQALIHAAYATCPECGYEFPPPEKEKHASQASNAGILSGQVEDTEYNVQDVAYYVHVKRGAPEDHPRTMRIDYQIGWKDWKSEWVCPEHTGYARGKFEAWWRARSNEPFPDSAEKTVELAECGALAETKQITVRTVAGEQFDRIVDYRLGDKSPRLDGSEERDNNLPDDEFVNDDSVPF